ncbi:MAG: GspH/FimT family protein [Desulfobacterales bacterium]|nr:MAG: GspH/FimT family protein [Desulfobacterales bacterium]
MIRNKSGFTFTELMTVLGIIAIASAIAVPNFISWIPKRKLGIASREMLSAMETARMRAVRERSNVIIQFPDNSNYMVWVDNGAGVGGAANDGVRNGTEPLIRNGSVPAGITITSANFSGNTSFLFDRRGFPLDLFGNPTNGQVRITNPKDGDFRDVNLSFGGNVSISRP